MDTAPDYPPTGFFCFGDSPHGDNIWPKPAGRYHTAIDGYWVPIRSRSWNGCAIVAEKSSWSLDIFLLRARCRVCNTWHVCHHWGSISARGRNPNDGYDPVLASPVYSFLLIIAVSIVVITFELTGALTYVLPIMIAVMISKWVGDAFGKRGIYESWIQFKDYPFLENRDDPVPDIPVVEVMTRIEDLIVVTQTGHTIDSLDELLRSHPYKGFPVVSDTREAGLVGYIARSELRFALRQARNVKNLPGHTDCVFGTASAGSSISVDMRPWMDDTPITLQQSSSLSLTATLFQKLGLRYILFAKHGELQGLLTKKDVYFILNSDEKINDGRHGIEERRLLADGQARDGSEYSLDSPNEERNLLGSL